jgi:tetraacyldisaccharide 4'-kinase
MSRSSITLAPFGALYGALTQTRLALFRRGLLKTSNLGVPVISVGNITAGGTGKTPLVEYIARALASEKRKVCILTRGYGRENPARRVLVSDGQSVLASAEEAGDEPRLLAQNLLRIAAVVSDRDRYSAGRWAIRELGTEVFILDDGFQHLRLARDLNVATIDATDPWGGGRLLPRGQMRESRNGLKRADCIVITRVDQAADLPSLIDQIERVSNRRPLFTSQMTMRGITKLADSFSEKAAPAHPDLSTPVVAFCAIGNPHAFFKQLENAGYNPVAVSQFSDHHRYEQRDVDTLIARAKETGAQNLITTAKDAVKLSNLSFQLPCYVFDIAIRIEEESRFVEILQAVIGANLPTS